MGHRLYSKMRSPAWVVCCLMVLAFASGIVVDIDHLLHYLRWREHGRYLMGYFETAGYILIGCGVIILLTCLGRRAFTGVLRR